MLRKAFPIFCLLLFPLFLCAQRAIKPNDIVVLFESDVHCAIDGYEKMALLAEQTRQRTPNVLLVSCGDFSMGNTMGAVSKGYYFVRLMNALGYDYVTLGNHEFDRGIDHARCLADSLRATMLCCNLVHLPDSLPLFAGYAVRRLGNMRVAFVGVTTPNTQYSNPSVFQDSLFRWNYSLLNDSLFRIVQRTVDQARSSGADKVILLSHLGDAIDQDSLSLRLIAATQGIDVVLDGHSHSVITGRYLRNLVGDSVLLAAVGYSFQNIGRLVLSQSGDISVQQVPTQSISPVLSQSLSSGRKARRASSQQSPSLHQRIVDTIAAIKAEYEAIGNRVIGETSVSLVIYDSLRYELVRKRETNMGDLCADAFRWLGQSDVAIVTAGALRGEFSPGPITFDQLYTALPYDDLLVKAELSGQEILDAIEKSVMKLPRYSGSFFQVAGLSFVIDTLVPSPVVLDSDKMFLSTSGPRRVSDVRVLDRATGRYLPLDPHRRYSVVATDYFLLERGGGVRFDSLKVLQRYQLNAFQTLEKFIAESLHGVVPSLYASPQNRIIYK